MNSRYPNNRPMKRVRVRFITRFLLIRRRSQSRHDPRTVRKSYREINFTATAMQSARKKRDGGRGALLGHQHHHVRPRRPARRRRRRHASQRRSRRRCYHTCYRGLISCVCSQQPEGEERRRAYVAAAAAAAAAAISPPSMYDILVSSLTLASHTLYAQQSLQKRNRGPFVPQTGKSKNSKCSVTRVKNGEL